MNRCSYQNFLIINSHIAKGIETEIPQKASGRNRLEELQWIARPERWEKLWRGIAQKLTMCHFEEIGVLFENSTA